MYIIGDKSKEAGKGKFAQELAGKIINELGKTFPKIDKRLSVWDDTEHYNWKEDESIWRQKRELADGEGECYFDHQFVSAYLHRDGINAAYVRFLSGLQELYKQNKVFVNPELYEIKRVEEEIKREKDVLDIPEARNEGEAMVVEVIKQHAKKKKRKTRIVK